MKKYISFDIGISSIGWSVLGFAKETPHVLGCGSVIFPPEDCQNQARAKHRQQRRHIAATRNRIKRLEKLFLTLEVLSEDDLSECRQKPHPWPWLLAARVISSDLVLDWKELWAVLRFYSHNRGYDGNALWAGEGSDPEDVEKVKSAHALMEQYNTETMCETICAFLEIDPRCDANPRLSRYFKGENAAFPRTVVMTEVELILKKHINKLQGMSKELCDMLLKDWRVGKDLGYKAKLPERFIGGLLFGQLKPRFENRIIPRCRQTGEKTPKKHSREYYAYRWAMLLANLRVNDSSEKRSRPLGLSERKKLNQVMVEKGYLTKSQLARAIERNLNLEPKNLESMFVIPEMEQALTLDPAKREVNGTIFKIVWREIPDLWKKLFLNQLFTERNYKGFPPSFEQWRSRMVEAGFCVKEFDLALKKAWIKESEKLAKKNIKVTSEEFSSRPLRISASHRAAGRASYSRQKLKDAVDYVMRGKDPRSCGGPLWGTSDIESKFTSIGIDQESNNHLVRHRLKVLNKVFSDIVERYADGDISKVDSVCVEVVRDLVQYSGKTAEEKAQLLGKQLWHHRQVSEFLEKERQRRSGDFEISASLIKKVRIADEMGWRCPYTGKEYTLSQILSGDVDREHIIPRSIRPTDAMHALVLTFKGINKEKGARTGLRYIEETALQSHTLCLEGYQSLVKKLKKKGPSKDDEDRCRKRKIALLTLDYDRRNNEANKDIEFTDGLLSQTSYLNKLAAKQIKNYILQKLSNEKKMPQIVQMPGSVTGVVRTAWDLFDQLREVCPEARGKIKTEIRSITHLHHALDSIVLALAVHFFPKDGRLWALLSKRKISKAEDRVYMCEVLRGIISLSADGTWRLKPLHDSLKGEIVERLKEKRVVRYNPRTMRGLKVQQNAWRVCGETAGDKSKMDIRMRARDPEGKRVLKVKSERKTKLLGFNPGKKDSKLKALKGTLVVEANYGVTLDPRPQVITYFQVWKQIKELQRQNGGRHVRILRNGDMISVKDGKYAGLWRIHSIKNANFGIALDIASLDTVKAKNKTEGSRMNVRLKSLLEGELQILNVGFCGPET